MFLTRENLVEGFPLSIKTKFESLHKVPGSDYLELSLDYHGNQVVIPVDSSWELRLELSREDLLGSLPQVFRVEVASLSVGNSLLWVSGDQEGVSVHVPLTIEASANLILGKKSMAAPPGEVIPVYKKKSTSSKTSRVGPPVGTEKTVNGVTKKLVRYDFVTPKLKGRRRVTCPESGKKGFPIWERI